METVMRSMTADEKIEEGYSGHVSSNENGTEDRQSACRCELPV
jgi:hypothetical protein